MNSIINKIARNDDAQVALLSVWLGSLAMIAIMILREAVPLVLAAF